MKNMNRMSESLERKNTVTSEYSTTFLKISIKNKASSQVQQSTDVSAGVFVNEAEVVKLNIVFEERKKSQRKEKLYAEVEFSAQGYDTLSNQLTGRHGPRRHGPKVLLSESIPTCSRLGCMSHTYNK